MDQKKPQKTARSITISSLNQASDQTNPTNSSSSSTTTTTGTADGRGRYIRSYTCTFCEKGFSNAQALGGHMNIHRRDRARLRNSHDSESRSKDDDSLTTMISWNLPQAADDRRHPQVRELFVDKPEVDLELRLGPLEGSLSTPSSSSSDPSKGS